MEPDVIRLSLEKKEATVIMTKADGEEVEYTLVELTGRERNKYLNKMTSRVQMKNGKAAGIKTFDGFQADLLKLCLLGPEKTLLTEEEIEALPSSAQMALFEKAQELSGLDNEEDEVEAKND